MLPDLDWPRNHVEAVEALPPYLEHRCVGSLVVVLEQSFIRLPRCAVYISGSDAWASFDNVGICNDETISGDQDTTTLISYVTGHKQYPSGKLFEYRFRRHVARRRTRT